ncbi:hypothetical protein [Nocardia farcinica]|uniref:hypothetical protein n=1 Tax=Nocardia farcinica TaxID=37329 RepID=UPI0024587765|nr:hypothetical protein [Nocardia farcinica]
MCARYNEAPPLIFGSAGAMTAGALTSMITATAAGRITAPAVRRWAGVLGALLFGPPRCG